MKVVFFLSGFDRVLSFSFLRHGKREWRGAWPLVVSILFSLREFYAASFPLCFGDLGLGFSGFFAVFMSYSWSTSIIFMLCYSSVTANDQIDCLLSHLAGQ